MIAIRDVIKIHDASDCLPPSCPAITESYPRLFKQQYPVRGQKFFLKFESQFVPVNIGSSHKFFFQQVSCQGSGYFSIQRVCHVPDGQCAGHIYFCSRLVQETG